MPPEPTPSPTPPTTPDPKDDVQSLKDQVAALLKEKETWSKGKPDPSPDPSLSDKVRKEQDDRNKKNSDSRALETALTFNMTIAESIKTNEALLPKDFGDILKVAEKETYGSASDKANATKAAMIQSYFSVQDNVDMLTASQQSTLAEYLKLTKNGKEDKAPEMYDNLFEPVLNMARRVRKAGELSKGKFGYKDSKSEDQYKQKMMALSKKHFLGEKI